MIDWQTQFLTLVLIVTKDPGSKPPRTLSELYGPDLNRTLLFHHDRPRFPLMIDGLFRDSG